MKVAVVCDAHIFCTSKGEHWCSSVYGYGFFQRFMNVFDDVRIVARVRSQEFPENGKYLRVDGPHLEVFPVEFFQGPAQMFPKLAKIYHSLDGFWQGCDVILYRMPSTTAQLAYTKSKHVHVPKGIEVVYNLRDELHDNTLSLPRKLIGYINDRYVAAACRDKDINGVSYVTQRTLQQYYPSYCRLHGEDEKHFENYYSTIQYKSEFINEPKRYEGKTNWVISHVVIHIQSKLRGHETIIKALKTVRDAGYNVEVEFIGDGPLVGEFKVLAERLGVAEYVNFVGLLPSAADVNERLRASDIFVYPTHFAGLPRVLIEAMGAGLPCISTPVSGIPEMLEPQDLISPDDDVALAKRLIEMFNDPKYLEQKSAKHIAMAAQYTNEVLQVRRDDFYTRLKRCVRG